MRWSFAILFLFSSLFAEIDYQKLMQQFPETLGRRGSWQRGEIQIASTTDEIKRVEKLTSRRFIRLGYSKEDAARYSHTGIIAEDHYWIWIRDAVTFPGGIPGTYDRMLWKSGLTGPPGVGIFPVLPNKKVVVNINFRHATRSWEMELPRGTREKNETPEQTAMRELKEETGYKATKLIMLGDLAPESRMIAGVIPVYYGEVREKKARHQEETEAIAHNAELTVDEIREAFDKGYLTRDIKGIKTKVYCRDPYLSFALLQALWRKLI